jgi:murein DD-endopeptidase MepM/ murein hydrolase activator NlpD
MRSRLPLDKFHIFLLLIAVISLSFNISFYFSFNELEKDLETVSSTETTELPEFPEAETKEAVSDDSLILFTVQSGDTLFKIFSDAGIAPTESHFISNSINKVYEVSKLKIGNQVEVKFLQEPDKPENEDYYSKVKYIKVITDDKVIEVDYHQDKNEYEAKLVEIPLTLKETFSQGEINDSLYISATNAGVSPYAVMDFIKLFSYDVDFQRDIKPGDKFEVYYNYLANHKDQKIRDGNIVYASLSLGGKKKEIFRYEDNEGNTDYYNRTGENIRKTLLKTPINGAKISSGFGMRKHPILGFSRMHKGLDYAAPRGTPVLAAGDGIIQFVKTSKTGYGKHVKIKHSSKYATLYAHLDRFSTGIKKGTRVSQGDVIGFVGATGLASGPHLHYEVHERENQVNPSKISFPKLPPLSNQKLKVFQTHLKNIDEMLQRFKKQIVKP